MQGWGLVDLIFTIFVVVGLQVMAAIAGFMLQIGPRPGRDESLSLPMMAWISTVQSLALVIVSFFIALRLGIKATSVGWSLGRIFQDIWLGILAFIVIAPPMYLLMVIVTKWSGTEYSHPIQEMASENPWLLIPAMFMAVILAPIGEEFVFRVLLQGFLESMSKGRFTIEKLLLGRRNAPAQEPSRPFGFDDVSKSSLPDGLQIDYVNPYVITNPTINIETQSDRVDASHLNSMNASDDECFVRKDSTDMNGMVTSLPWWPIFVSGILFGLVHFEYGMSWIPLSILGIALGWLYRVTNRIWPSLVVHICVNSTSMIGFALTVFFGDPTKA